jgi:hypothetical protein
MTFPRSTVSRHVAQGKIRSLIVQVGIVVEIVLDAFFPSPAHDISLTTGTLPFFDRIVLPSRGRFVVIQLRMRVQTDPLAQLLLTLRQ